MKQFSFSDTIPLVQEKDGTVRVTGSRVTLDTIIGNFQKGATAAQIHDSFPSLSTQEIEVVIAYYLENQTDVEQYLKDRREEADKVKQHIESAQDSSEFRAKIRSRRQQLVRS